MTASLLIPPVARFFKDDGSGEPLSFGWVYTYAAGTDTPKDSYTTYVGNVANTNPVELDANGEANIWLNGNYKINVKDENFEQIDNYPVDNVSSSTGGSGTTPYVLTTGVANVYVATPSAALVAYVTGISYYVRPNIINFGPSTINFSGLGNKNITLQNAVALTAGDFNPVYIYEMIYDGTQFVIQGSMSFQPASLVAITGGTVSGIALSGSTIETSLINEKHGTAVTAATSIDLASTTGNFITISGNTTINTIVLPDGYERVLYMTGTPTFTNSSTLVVQSGANFVAASGDMLLVRGGPTSVVYLSIIKKNNKFVDFNGTYPAGNGAAITNIAASANPGILNAWINFNGTGTPAARDSLNISSITDNGDGDYTINFSPAFSNANYACVVSTGNTADVAVLSRYVSQSSSAIRIETAPFSGANVDAVRVMLVAVGDA